MIDDCTRPLEYCEVFDETYTKQPDLCYKALMRRAQGLRGMKEFNDAIHDLEEAHKLFPNESDPLRLKEKYEADRELEEKINAIMADSDSLKGKEFIDFLLNYLQGKGPQPDGAAAKDS